jgi:hypothetical protein
MEGELGLEPKHTAYETGEHLALLSQSNIIIILKFFSII